MVDLVLAMAGGYDAAQLRPFVRSLRATGFAGEIRLLLHRNPPGTAEALRAEGAIPIEVALEGVPETWSYNVVRYRLFAEQLAGCDARRVILSDSRDVIFQRDPFAGLDCEDSVHLFEEHPDKPIAKCIWTQSWLRYRYGDAALPPIADRPVICSGVVIGSTRRVADFVRLVAAEILPSLKATNYMAGYDQGVVNVQAYSGRFGGLVLHPWAGASVVHLGNAPSEAVRVGHDGQVLNLKGEIAALAHQYDRHPGVAERTVKAEWR